MTEQCTIEKRESDVPQTEQMHGGEHYAPAVDIVEHEGELLLLADMPGTAADAVDINYERGVLTVRGNVAQRQDPAKANFLLHEYGVGNFYRRFEIGEGIDPSGIHAELHDGVLTIHLPKAKALKPRRIAVKTS